jgi:hypothetical protein
VLKAPPMALCPTIPHVLVSRLLGPVVKPRPALDGLVFAGQRPLNCSARNHGCADAVGGQDLVRTVWGGRGLTIRGGQTGATPLLSKTTASLFGDRAPLNRGRSASEPAARAIRRVLTDKDQAVGPAGAGQGRPSLDTVSANEEVLCR